MLNNEFKRSPSKKPKREDNSSSSSGESEQEPEREPVTPGGELSSRIVAFEQNTTRRQIMKSKLVKKRHIFTLHITLINGF